MKVWRRQIEAAKAVSWKGLRHDDFVNLSAKAQMVLKGISKDKFHKKFSEELFKRKMAESLDLDQELKNIKSLNL